MSQNKAKKKRKVRANARSVMGPLIRAWKDAKPTYEELCKLGGKQEYSGPMSVAAAGYSTPLSSHDAVAWYHAGKIDEYTAAYVLLWQGKYATKESIISLACHALPMSVLRKKLRTSRP